MLTCEDPATAAAVRRAVSLHRVSVWLVSQSALATLRAELDSVAGTWNGADCMFRASPGGRWDVFVLA